MFFCLDTTTVWPVRVSEGDVKQVWFQGLQSATLFIAVDDRALCHTTDKLSYGSCKPSPDQFCTCGCRGGGGGGGGGGGEARGDRGGETGLREG